MMAHTAAVREPVIQKMPGHWLLARMGKRVLRPGGLELTRHLLAELAISADEEVVEFAPGLGVTARMTLERNPRSYTAIERDNEAAQTVRAYLSGSRHKCVVGTAEQTGLADKSASVVYGEAMLSMQPDQTKRRIIAEAARLLRPGGRYGIHELSLVPDDVDNSIRESIRQELTDEIHVGVRPLTVGEWRELLEGAGLTVVSEHTALMHLLEPLRLIKDEGLFRALRFVWNVATHSQARQRVLRMRRVFRKYSSHLAAISLIAVKNNEAPQ
jgi:SAM-dependent methyltransferase